jgi:hypothetical protein
MKTDGPVLHKHEWEVRPVSIALARRLVEQYHYAAHASNTAVAIHGLVQVGQFFDEPCYGVAWWLPPTRAAAEATYPANWQGVLSLSRLVVVPGMPQNAASFLLARSMKLLDREAWPCLVTYADTYQGHTGAIYRATNWRYAGLTDSTPVWVKDGRIVARKATHTRTVAEMEALGAVLVGNYPKHKFVCGAS